MARTARGSEGTDAAAIASKRSHERRPALGRQLEPGRAGVTAVAREQVGARLQGRPEVHRPVAPARCADRVPELRADDRRPRAVLRQSRRDQARRCRPATDRGRSPPGGPGRPRRAPAPRRRPWPSGRGGSGSRPRGRRHGPRPRRRPRPAAAGPPPAPPPPGRPRSGAGRARRRSCRGPCRPGRSRARSRSAAMPGRGRGASAPGPSRAIARFSPTIGATSATVPMVARSARSSAAAGPPGSSARISCATLNATPLPARRRPGTRESARCGLTTATAGGRIAGHAMVVGDDDVDAALAATAISAAELDPVSTVTMTLTPFRCGRVDRGERQAVALVQPARDVRLHGQAEPPQGQDEDRQAVEAVGVEVAEDHDPLADRRGPWSAERALDRRRAGVAGRAGRPADRRTRHPGRRRRSRRAVRAGPSSAPRCRVRAPRRRDPGPISCVSGKLQRKRGSSTSSGCHGALTRASIRSRRGA